VLGLLQHGYQCQPIKVAIKPLPLSRPRIWR
jgi:hypothetical protein